MIKRKTAVLVISHKPYWVPEDPAYLPVRVGKDQTDEAGWHRDNEGENIAEKNPSFCELTGLYWAWKNVDAEVYGLCHYRRYMGRRRPGNRKNRILTGKEIREMLTGADVLLPGKRHYWIETRESQYIHAHHAEDLRCAEEILREKYPEYLPAWNRMLKSRSGHICNMFVMRGELFGEYCAWLFDILFEAERRLDITAYSANDRRVFGFLGERLLDVWVSTKGLRIRETAMITLEKQHWIKKGTAFIRRKLWPG